MRVDFVSIVSAQYSATASAEGLTVTAHVNVSGDHVDRITSGTVSREDGVCVAGFSTQGGGSKDISFYSGINVDEAAVLNAVNGFIAGANDTARQKGGAA